MVRFLLGHGFTLKYSQGFFKVIIRCKVLVFFEQKKRIFFLPSLILHFKPFKGFTCYAIHTFNVWQIALQTAYPPH